MREEATRAVQWEKLSVEQMLYFIAHDLDEIEQTAREHREDDRKSFNEVKNQNRWIFTALVMALIEILTVMVVFVVTR